MFFTSRPKPSTETKILLLDEVRGAPIPRCFAREFDFKDWNLTPKTDFDPSAVQLAADLSGPGNEAYWDAWEYVLTNALYESDGKDGLLPGRWTLEHDGDLFAVHESHEESDQ